MLKDNTLDEKDFLQNGVELFLKLRPNGLSYMFTIPSKVSKYLAKDKNYIVFFKGLPPLFIDHLSKKSKSNLVITVPPSYVKSKMLEPFKKYKILLAPYSYN